MRINGSIIGSTVTPSFLSGATGVWSMQNVELANRQIIWPTNIVTNGLVLFLDANNTNSYPGSGTSWYDLSGNGNTGTLTNGPTFSNENGGTIVFDGVDDYVNVANASSLNASAQTISVWYNATVVPGRPAVLVGKHDTAGSNNGYNLWTSNYAQIKVANVGYDSGLATGVTNVWYHLTLAYTSNVSLTGYLNGVSMGTSGLANFSISSQPLRIGRSVDSFWSLFTGKIPVVTVHNRQLTAAEVLQNFQATRTRFGV
jgi:hypothetical protein